MYMIWFNLIIFFFQNSTENIKQLLLEKEHQVELLSVVHSKSMSEVKFLAAWAMSLIQ